MARLTPQEAGAKLQQRISQSGAAYEAGVMNVRENPAAKAIAANDKWIAGINDAIANNRFVKGLQSVTLSSWQTSVRTYGTSRYTQGAVKAGANYTKFATEFFPFLDQVSAQVNAMPNLTFEDNIARMVANARALHEFRNR